MTEKIDNDDFMDDLLDASDDVDFEFDEETTPAEKLKAEADEHKHRKSYAEAVLCTYENYGREALSSDEIKTLEEIYGMNWQLLHGLKSKKIMEYLSIKTDSDTIDEDLDFIETKSTATHDTHTQVQSFASVRSRRLLETVLTLGIVFIAFIGTVVFLSSPNEPSNLKLTTVEAMANDKVKALEIAPTAFKPLEIEHKPVTQESINSGWISFGKISAIAWASIAGIFFAIFFVRSVYAFATRVFPLTYKTY